MEETGVKRELAVIRAADVEGYSRLMGADEEAALKVPRAFREIIDGLIARHEGRVVGKAARCREATMLRRWCKAFVARTSARKSENGLSCAFAAGRSPLRRFPDIGTYAARLRGGYRTSGARDAMGRDPGRYQMWQGLAIGGTFRWAELGTTAARQRAATTGREDSLAAGSHRGLGNRLIDPSPVDQQTLSAPASGQVSRQNMRISAPNGICRRDRRVVVSVFK